MVQGVEFQSKKKQQQQKNSVSRSLHSLARQDGPCSEGGGLGAQRGDVSPSLGMSLWGVVREAETQNQVGGEGINGGQGRCWQKEEYGTGPEAAGWEYVPKAANN